MSYLKGVLLMILSFMIASLGLAVAYIGSTLAFPLVVIPALLSVILVASGFHLDLSSLIYIFKRGSIWPCSCPLCSLVAIRFAGLNGGGSIGEVEGVGIEGFSENPLASITSQDVDLGTGSPLASSESSKESKEPQPITLPQPQEGILEAISSLEDEVKGIREELQTALEELRNSITIVKSEVDEVKNPFNFMRSIAEFLDEETKNAILTLSNMMAAGRGGEGPLYARLDLQRLPGSPHQSHGMISMGAISSDFLDLLDLIVWLDGIYNSKEWEELKELGEVIESTRIIPISKLRILKAAMEFVERTRSKGERVASKVRLLYVIARQAGIINDMRGLRILDYLAKNNG